MNHLIAALFENEIFNRSRVEIEALGFKLSPSPFPGSRPYAVIAGRSNARWWLISLENGRLANSGLALFQPVVPSAKMLKLGALLANSFGLSRLWARKVLYISGESSLADIFSDHDLRYAFFTGTDSPHRKSAVQIMDRDGVLKGFAKTSRNPAIKPLLRHEATTLDRLHTLGLKTALLPRVLFSGELGGADVLVTDTLKTPRTKTATTLNRSHVAFLRELSAKTSLPGREGTDRFVTEMRNHYAEVAHNLPEEWQQRLEKALAVLGRYNGNLGPGCLSHGDFTPWNTFFVDGKLYVFDWEYAQQENSPGYDLIHFVLSNPTIARKPVNEAHYLVQKILQVIEFAQDKASAELLFLSYLCGHSLHYAARDFTRAGTKVKNWEGEQKAAEFIDTSLVNLGNY